MNSSERREIPGFRCKPDLRFLKVVHWKAFCALCVGEAEVTLRAVRSDVDSANREMSEDNPRSEPGYVSTRITCQLA